MNVANNNNKKQNKKKNMYIAAGICGMICYILAALFYDTKNTTTTNNNNSKFKQPAAPILPLPLHVLSRKVTDNSTATLWLITCETNETNPFFRIWYQSAKKFQKNHRQNQRLYQHQEDISTLPSFIQRNQIRIVNACSGSNSWSGFMLKIEKTQSLLMDILNKHPLEKRHEHLVVFTDSDSFFNSFAVSYRTLLERFDRARSKSLILASAEPACSIGFECDPQDVKNLYQDATTKSNCPQFLNSGQYMGSAQAILYMLKWLMQMKHEHKNDRANTNDQYRMALFHARNPGFIHLDTGAQVFRAMTYGVIDSSQPGKLTCGIDGVQACGEFKDPRLGKWNNSSKSIEMENVPGCTAEDLPFSVHYPGPTKHLKEALNMKYQMMQLYQVA